MYRIHRLDQSRRVRRLRLAIAAAEGDAPTLREVEFFERPPAEIPFPPWAVVVSTTGSTKVPGEGAAGFRRLARSCAGWDQLPFQNVWLGDFHEQFVTLEPRPPCGFLSGNFIDWCQQNREHWRGTAEVLKAGRLPLWASCGGAQGLAILAENGIDQPWDCPQCRDSDHPRLPNPWAKLIVRIHGRCRAPNWVQHLPSGKSLTCYEMLRFPVFSTPCRGVLPPSDQQIIAEAWQGVLRHADLEAMPVRAGFRHRQPSNVAASTTRN